MDIKKGRLTVFLSYTPGAGKSYLMISEAIGEKVCGSKVIIGFLNSSHRDIKQMLQDNNISMPDCGTYSLSELIQTRPDLIIMDEMGMSGLNRDSVKRTFVYDDIEKLLNEGIDVFATVNIKRFESANPMFKEITGIRVKKMVPDRFLDLADRIIFVDREPELMVKDFVEGKLFGEEIMHSKIMKKNFEKNTLTAYRNISRKFLEKYEDKVKIIVR